EAASKAERVPRRMMRTRTAVQFPRDIKARQALRLAWCSTPVLSHASTRREGKAMRRTRHTQALIGNGAVITRDAVDLGHPVAHGLARTGRRDGEWVCSTFEMAEELADHRALRDNGDEPQRAALAQRTGDHLQMKHSPQEPRPRP